MKRRSGHIGLLLAAMLVLGACKPSVPGEYLQPDDMEDVLYDYFVAQGMAQSGSHPDSVEYKRDLYFNAVLKKYGITRAEFDSSLVYYYTRADRLAPIYKHLQERLNDDALALGASEGEMQRFASQNLNGDTADVWEGRRHLMLTPIAPDNHVQFVQRADTSYHKGDSYMLTFKSDFLYQSGSKDAVACLAVTYDNDSVISTVTHFSVSGGTTQLRLNPCDLKPKSLMAFFFLGGGQEQTANLRLLFLSQLQLIRMHRKESPSTASTAAKPDSLSALGADSLRQMPDSLRPQRHRLGERPMPQEGLEPNQRVQPNRQGDPKQQPLIMYKDVRNKRK